MSDNFETTFGIIVFFQKTNEQIRFFRLTVCTKNESVHLFLEESEDTKKSFRNYLTFSIMEILPILHTSEQKQLAFWSLKSAPCRIYGGKKGWFVEHLYAVSIKSFGITFYSIARIIQRLIKMSGISTYLMFSRPLETINLFCPDVYVLRMAAVH